MSLLVSSINHHHDYSKNCNRLQSITTDYYPMTGQNRVKFPRSKILYISA